MNRFIPQMNKDQEEILKERNKYYELLELDPSTLVVSIGTEQFVVGNIVNITLHLIMLKILSDGD